VSALIFSFITLAWLSVIYSFSGTITFQSSQTILSKAILLIADFPSFLTICSTFLNGVKINQYLSTLEYEARCNTSQMFGHSGVAIGHILQY
jgi:hypothetical protein